MPSMPRSPNPPGTITPSHSPKISGADAGVIRSASNQRKSILAPFSIPACVSASTMERYASYILTYLPTNPIVTVLLREYALRNISFHTVKSGGVSASPNSRETISEKRLFSSMTGASYKMGTSKFSITQSGGTLQNMEILRRADSSIG